MKHTPDLAPPPRPDASTRLDGEAAMFGAMRLAEALATPILFRHERGRVAYLNQAAKRELRLDSIVDFEMTLTIIRRGVEKQQNRNVYLLSADMEPIARLVAEPAVLGIPGFQDVEVITLDPSRTGTDENGASTRIEARRNDDKALANSHGSDDRPERSTFTPRDLLACAARRLRRHFGDRIRIALGVTPKHTRERGLTVDEIALAEVVLSAASWLVSASLPRCLTISAVTAGPRLRLVIERDLEQIEFAPPLDCERDWPRSMRPFLDGHRATFEIHDEAHQRRIAISLPILPLPVR